MPLTRSRLLPKLPWKALYFDGQDDYVEVLYSEELYPRAQITVEAMGMVFELGVHRTFVGRHTSTDNAAGTLRINSGGYPDFLINIGGTFYPIASPDPVQTNEYVHVVGVYDGAKIKLYVDGVLKKEENANGMITENTRSTIIGRYQTGNYEQFYGYIALVRIYSRGLTDSEVLWNYYHPDDPIRSGLVLWLHYDSIDEENNLWRNKTANGNDGTIYGATAVEFTKPPIRKLTPSRILSPVR